MYRIALILALALFAASCGGRRSRPQQTACVSQPRVFLPAIAPARLSPQEQRDYLRWHYWDRFDFADTLFVREADTAQMVEAYARWVALISDRPADAAPMDSLMRRASASRPMLDYFTMLAQQVIHDPNSPLRNDEFYIPVMQAVLASPYYDEYERIGPAYDLAMASQNRLGQRANDFRYTLASGATGTLYGVKAEYTLLFINNPGCGMCKQLREQISGSLSRRRPHRVAELPRPYPRELDQRLRCRLPRPRKRHLRPDGHSVALPAGQRQARAGEGFHRRALYRRGYRPERVGRPALSAVLPHHFPSLSFPSRHILSSCFLFAAVSFSAVLPLPFLPAVPASARAGISHPL